MVLSLACARTVARVIDAYILCTDRLAQTKSDVSPVRDTRPVSVTPLLTDDREFETALLHTARPARSHVPLAGARSTQSSTTR
jgi:hypothetical protein